MTMRYEIYVVMKTHTLAFYTADYGNCRVDSQQIRKFSFFCPDRLHYKNYMG
jgi:hypothetical protein